LKKASGSDPDKKGYLKRVLCFSDHFHLNAVFSSERHAHRAKFSIDRCIANSHFRQFSANCIGGRRLKIISDLRSQRGLPVAEKDCRNRSLWVNLWLEFSRCKDFELGN